MASRLPCNYWNSLGYAFSKGPLNWLFKYFQSQRIEYISNFKLFRFAAQFRLDSRRLAGLDRE